MKDIGASDIRIAYIYNGANDDASAGAATVTINYLQNNNLSIINNLVWASAHT